MKVQLRSTLRKNTPHKIPFQKIKDEVLGTNYNLSILICSDALALSINKKFRKKDYTPNTLSFSYGPHSGEIILNQKQSDKEAASFSHTKFEHFLFLYIHSLLHLKGYTHGHQMEKEERKLFAKFRNTKA